MVWLNKKCAQLGLCARNEADSFLKLGLVLVDGKVATSPEVSDDAKVSLAPRAQHIQDAKISVLLHKPLHYVSMAAPAKSYPLARRLLEPDNAYGRRRGKTGGLDPSKARKMVVAGRLDVESTGLLAFTQDGRIASYIPYLEKEYDVTVKGVISSTALDLLRHGLALDGVPLEPCDVDHIGENMLRMVLTQGRQRQIRRMGKLVGLHVTALHRTRIGGVHLKGLGLGQWRVVPYWEWGFTNAHFRHHVEECSDTVEDI